jgi:hypothetical protein
MTSSGRIKFSTLLFLLITAGIIYLAVYLFPPWMDYFTFKGDMSEKAKVGNTLSDEEILRDLGENAKELNIPLKEGAIQISRQESEMSIAADWDIDTTLVGDVVFTLHFAPHVTEHFR